MNSDFEKNANFGALNANYFVHKAVTLFLYYITKA